MNNYIITQEQLNTLSAIINKVPTEFGIPLINVLNTLQKVEPKVEEK